MNHVIKSLKWFIAIMAVIVAVGVSPVAAVPTAIDGNLNDWGLSKLVTASWAENETWLPSSGIHFIIENDQNPLSTETGPKGVHIRGTSANYVFYNEPKVQLVGSGSWRSPPVGGEPFDLEAIYLDQDNTNLYLAIVTSVDPSLAGGSRPGDIALNMDKDPTTGDLGYEYGIVCGQDPYPSKLGLKQGDIVYLPKWENKGAVDMEAAEVIVGFLPGGGVVGNLGSNFAYNKQWMTVVDNKHPNWVIEAAIPFADVGGKPATKMSLSDVFYADNCINDSFYVPEFPTIAVSAGAILGLVFVISLIREKKKE